MTLPARALRLCLFLAMTLTGPALTGCALPFGARETPAEHAAATYAAAEMAAAPLHGNLPDYALSPAKLLQARHLSSLGVTLHFGSELWRILQLILLLWFGGIAWMRDIALRSGRGRWLQAYVFLGLLFAARTLLNLPLSLYGHHLSLVYGFSIQRWPSWFADIGKSFLLNWAVGGLLLMLFVALIRFSPRRWWLLLAAAGIPITLAGAILYPIAVDPLFYRFEPLAAHHPDLVADLQRMKIPADRTFLMRASAKLTTPNAYVIGLGPTKRLVVWDTQLDRSAHDPSARAELLWTLGHESGHFVLGHVRQGILLTLVLLPLLTWLAYLALTWTLHRFGHSWRIPATSDWGAAAILLLLIALGNALAEPIANTVSRHVEHDADVYGQEAIHNLVPGPPNAVQLAVQSAADSMGASILDDPNPSPLIEFWLYNHPSTGRRAAFGRAYDPWAPGMQPKYFKR